MDNNNEPILNRQENLELQYFQKIVLLTEYIKVLNVEISLLKSQIVELSNNTHKELTKEIRTEQRVKELTENLKSEKRQRENMIKQLSEAANRIVGLERKIKELEKNNSK